MLNSRTGLAVLVGFSFGVALVISGGGLARRCDGRSRPQYRDRNRSRLERCRLRNRLLSSPDRPIGLRMPRHPPASAAERPQVSEAPATIFESAQLLKGGVQHFAGP